MGFKKSLKKLREEPTHMRLNEIEVILKVYGYQLKRVKGSHFHFVHKGKGWVFTIPVHQKRVAQRYLKKIISDIIEPRYEK